MAKGRQGRGHPWGKVGLGTAQAISQCCWHSLASTQCYQEIKRSALLVLPAALPWSRRLCPRSAQQLSGPEQGAYLCCHSPGPVPSQGVPAAALGRHRAGMALIECVLFVGLCFDDQCKGWWLLPANLHCSYTAGQLKQSRIWLGLLRLSLGREVH